MKPVRSTTLLPGMIGLVPRARPTITVERYDAGRLAIIEACERQPLIEAIAGHLRRRQRGSMSLREMYA